MNWNVLGIEPTKDKSAITKAYRARLSSVNPEDKPEEFKELRAAYEEAMSFADEVEVPDEEKTPIQLWIDRVDEVYGYYPSRISPEAWNEVIHDDLCIGLDTRPEAEEKLLAYLMGHTHLPQLVWQTLDQEFDWIARSEELSEVFPPDFIKYCIVNGARYGEIIPYTMFTPGLNAEQCDEYVRLCLDARNSSGDERRSLIERFMALDESHPYGLALFYQQQLDDEVADCLDDLLGLADAYPDDDVLVPIAIRRLLDAERLDDCDKRCRDYLERHDDNEEVLLLHAKCLAAMGDYSKASDIASNLMRRAGGDSTKLHELDQYRSQWNAALVEKYEAELVERPDDDELRFELAWSYLLNDRDNESWEVAKLIKGENLNAFKYHNLIGQIQESLGNFAESLEHNKIMVEYIRNIQVGLDEEDDKRAKRLSEKLAACGRNLLFMGKVDECLAYMDEALEVDPEDANLLNEVARMSLFNREFGKAVEYADRLIKVMPGSGHGYLLAAFANYELHNDRDAFDAINACIEVDGTDVAQYVVKMLILIRNGAFEEAHAIVDFLDANGFGESSAAKYGTALMIELEEEDAARAAQLYEELDKQIAGGDEFFHMVEMYFRWAMAFSKTVDMDEEPNRTKVLEILDKGLAIESRDEDLLDYKGWMLAKLGRVDEAIECYRKEVALPHHSLTAESGLADLLRRDDVHHAAEAYACYEKLLEFEPENAVHLFYAGNMLMEMLRYDEAEKLFLREMEVEPDCADPYRRLSYVYEAQRRYDDALAMEDKCLELVKDDKRTRNSHLRRKVQILRRAARPDDALAVLRQITKEFGVDTRRSLYEILIQYGRFDEVHDLIKEWKKDKDASTRGDSAYAIVMTDFLEGHYVRGRWGLVDRGSCMSDYDRRELKFVADGTAGECEYEIEQRLKLLAEADSTNFDSISYHASNLAECYWRSGDVDKCVEYATKAVEACDAALGLHYQYKVIFMTRKANCLGFLGRFDEAFALLEEARSLPMCRFCAHCGCKDADIYEARLLCLMGKVDESMRFTEECLEKWPDETDFIIHKTYMESKGAKKQKRGGK